MKHEEGEFESGSASWLLAFILGGLLGAAAALLFAPKSGRQTREQIKDMALDAREKAGSYYDQAKSRVSSAMQKGAEVFQQKKEEAKSEAAEAVK
jgi:gas vesicle protein